MKVTLSPKAKKQLMKLEKQTQQRIIAALENMADNIDAADLKKLRGANLWRLRVGDYRILLRFSDGRAEVLVLRIKHRKNAYKEI